MNYALRILAIGVILGTAFAFTLERPPIKTVQNGYRGLGQLQVYNSRALYSPEAKALNAVPEPEDKIDLAGTPSSQVYQNVQVLKDLDSNELLRLMNAITKWVAPEQGCAYCHGEGGNMADDSLYTKVVARRMLQMTQTINANWKNHVGATGVTCYTCHRGNPVPKEIWYSSPNEPHGVVGNNAGKNAPALAAGLSSLPHDPFTPFLLNSENIRVVGTTALPAENHSSIKQAEWTYALMMHMSKSLGVNCTYCHNTRAFSAWDESSLQRTTAWHGIRMVRDINTTFLTPLTEKFPSYRLGNHGDVAKVNCATCHQGAYKPLYGASMLGDYQELSGVQTSPSAATAPAQ